MPLVLLNCHQCLSTLAGPPVVVIVAAIPGFCSDEEWTLSCNINSPLFTCYRGVSQLCGSAKVSCFPFESNCNKSLFHVQCLHVRSTGVGTRDRWALSWGVTDNLIPNWRAFTWNNGTHLFPQGPETGIGTKWLKHLKMKSTAIFEVESSVTFIRCRPDSIHMFSVPVRRQEIVRLLPPLLARGTKGSKSQV